MNILKIFKFDFPKEQNNRISKNLISQISLNSSLTILQILFPPLMIMTYGLENFGIWIFLTAIPTTLSIFNFDLTAAAKTEMSINHNKNNKNKVNEIFNNAIILLIVITIFLILITALIINFYDFNLDILKDITTNQLKLILVCIFLSFYLNIFNSIFKTGITYWGKLYISTYVDTFFNFFSKILIIIAGLIFKELLFASIFLLIASVLKLIVYYYFFLNYNQYLTFSLTLFSKKQIRELFKLSIPYYLNSITGVIKNSFQIIILGLFFNSQILGMISTLKTLFHFLPIRVWSMIRNAIFFEFIKLYSEKKFDLLKKNYSKFIKYTVIFVILFLLTSTLLGEYIYNLWLNNTYNLDYNLLLLMVFEISFLILASSISILNKSINKFFHISIVELVINSIIILISCLLFYYQKSYYFLFLFNLAGSLLLIICSIYFSKKLIRKDLI